MSFYKKIKFWIILAIIVIAIILYAKSLLKKIEVKGYEVKKQELIISVTATSTGTIKADNEVKLTAQKIGRIKKLFVEEGSIIKKGNIVAEMEFDESQQRLNMSSAVLQRMQANLESLKLGSNSFRTDIEENISKSLAVLNEAESRLRRFKELKEKGYIAQIDYDTVKREYDVAKANNDSAIAAREQIKSKAEEIKSLEAAVKEAQSEHSLAKINHDYSFMRTPISGVITSRPVKIGDTVSIGVLIAAVVSTDSLYIEAFIDEADVAKLSLGQPVNISLDAYPGQIFTGEIYMISPVVLGGKQEARTFEIRVKFRENGINIKHGMSADVEVIVDRIKDILIVPSQAIVEKSDAKFVYLNRKGKAVMTKVSTARYNWNFTEVTDGIKEGDIIVINPDTPGLADGKRIKIAKSGK